MKNKKYSFSDAQVSDGRNFMLDGNRIASRNFNADNSGSPADQITSAVQSNLSEIAPENIMSKFKAKDSFVVVLGLAAIGTAIYFKKLWSTLLAVGMVSGASYYFYNKNKKSVTTAPTASATTPEVSTTKAVNTGIAQPVVTNPTPVSTNVAPTTASTTTSTPTTPVSSTPLATTNSASFRDVVNVQNKAVLIGVTGLNLKVGDKVNVVSPVYNGTFPIWYVYQGNAGVQNIYIETPFVSASTGTVTKI